jgi:hypothetical protein
MTNEPLPGPRKKVKPSRGRSQESKKEDKMGFHYQERYR